MSIKKFKKNREVDENYLNIPYKYITSVYGKNFGGNDKYEFIPYEEFRDDMKEEWDTDISKENYMEIINRAIKGGYEYLYKRKIKEAKNKDLCIIDFFGKKWALVAWRNKKRCSVGMPKLCRIVKKKKKIYVIYKGNDILISDNNGWVLS